MSFTQSKDSVDAGQQVTMALQGESRATGNNYTGFLPEHGITRPGMRPQVNGSPGTSDAQARGTGSSIDMTTPAVASDETSAIVDSYNLHGHNSYAYMPHLHPDYSSEANERFDFGSNGFVTPLTNSTGVYTTRSMDFNHMYYGGDGGQYGNYNRATNQLHKIDGQTTNIVYESDGVTVDTMATYFKQQASQLSADSMRGEHTAMSFAIKLGSGLQTGEYTPFCLSLIHI